MSEWSRPSDRPPSCHLSLPPPRPLIALACVLVCMACARSPGSPQLYAIGDAVDVDGWRVTVHSFSELPADEWRQPAPGQVLCAVEVRLENLSDQIRFFMPERQMILLDAQGRSYTLDHTARVVAATTHGWLVPEGELSVGQSAHGAAAYQIPSQAGEVHWVFRSNLLPWAPQVIFVLEEPSTPT
jgi:hypothetical protein